MPSDSVFREIVEDLKHKGLNDLDPSEMRLLASGALTFLLAVGDRVSVMDGRMESVEDKLTLLVKNGASKDKRFGVIAALMAGLATALINGIFLYLS